MENIVAERHSGRTKRVSRKADQIQRQCSLFSVANMAIKGDFETIALTPNKGLLIQEGKFKLAVITIAKFTREIQK